ncbi:MAG: single-stranded-DNA-specific exonuclease RecJ [Candidatus Pacebacteria bacterium]|nr:single-stranded-DNA-specific exonuclease RecJ [Candidatus Paceibacterota bacterium]
MAPYRIRKEIPKSIKKELQKYSPLLQKLLYYRGITVRKDAEEFLDPDWERDIHDPFLIHNMEKAVGRILKAIDKNEKILIYGDYDADGIPGSVVLHDFFKKIGYKNFSNYIPHRHDEGYGFHISAVKQFKKDKIKLIITVDVGITDIETVAYAQKNNIDVIVTDHHIPAMKDGKDGKDVVPDAFAVINSKQQDDTYPDDMLCGAGVAFKLVQALFKKGKEIGKFQEVPNGWEKWLLDMAGLSTIADMVPLKKENRVLAYYGLTVLRKSKRLGLVTLLQKMGMNQKYLTEDDLGFMVVPRINAASRMDHPLRAFELLATQDLAEAEKLADHLNHINDQRKEHVASMIKAAKKKLFERELPGVVVVGDPKWNPGILGLAANKLVEEYERPVFVWGYDSDGEIKGSCRGIGNVSLVELMRELQDTFIDVGGHFDAGGFSISHDNIHTLEEKLSDLYEKMKNEDEKQQMTVDSTLTLDEVNWNTFNGIDKLGPFGVENERPVFLFENIEIDNVRSFGKEKNHLGIDFKNSCGKKISSIGFFMTPETFPEVNLGVGEKIHLIGVMERSTFRNIVELRLRIEKVLPPIN